MAILLSIFGAFAIFGFFIWLLSFYWKRIVDSNINVHFRAAESITQHDQLPDEWVAEVTRTVSSVTATLFGLRKPSGIQLLLKKIDRTIRFFEEGSFYANDEAKELVLARLAEERKRVESMTWNEVLLERNQIRS